MKLSFLVIIITLLTPFVFAKKYNYKDYWTENTVKSTDGEFSFYVKTSPVKYMNAVAFMTVSKNNKLSEAEVFNQLKSPFTNQKWITQKLDGLNIYEYYDNQTTNLFRYAFNPKNKQYSYSSVKLRFLQPSYTEIHLLQVEKLTQTQSKTTAAFLIENLFLNFAHAQVSLDPVQRWVAEIGQGALEPSNEILNGARTDIQGARGDIQGVKTEAKKLNTTAKQIGLITLATSPLGSAFLVSVSSMAFDAAEKIWNNIRGEFSDKEKLKQYEEFKKALGTYKLSVKNMNSVEQQLTKLVSQIDQNAEMALNRLQNQLNDKKENLKKLTEAGTTTCENCVAVEQAAIKKIESEIKQLTETLNVNAEFCQELDTVYADWEATESQLAESQYLILKDIGSFIGVSYDISESVKKLSTRSSDKNANACMNDAEFNLKKLMEKDQFFDKSKCTEDSQDESCIIHNNNISRYNLCLNLPKLSNLESMQKGLDTSIKRMNTHLVVLAKSIEKENCGNKNKNGVCEQTSPRAQKVNAVKNIFNGLAEKCPDSYMAQVKKLQTEVDTTDFKPRNLMDYLGFSK